MLTMKIRNYFEFYRNVKTNFKKNPTCRIRTSDLRIYLQTLQSSALPTELRSDTCISFYTLDYYIEFEANSTKKYIIYLDECLLF
jgi:hypothetical protein